MAAFASMAMWFCGLSCVTSASRAVYSLARDHGMPFAGLMQRVNKKHGTPAAAIWAVVIASLAAMAWTGAVPIVTSLSTVALYLAYVIPVGAGIARPPARLHLAGLGRMDARPLGNGRQFHRAVLHRVHLFRTHHAAESTGGENTRRSLGRARLDLCNRSAATNIRAPNGRDRRRTSRLRSIICSTKSPRFHFPPGSSSAAPPYGAFPPASKRRAFASRWW